jgi:hypothetical protein
LGLILWIARKSGDRPQYAPAIMAAAFLISCLVVAVAPVRWTEVARPWPIFLIVIIVATAWRLPKCNPHDSDPVPRLRLSLAVFALAMLLRILLNAHLHHYGFVLAMPATAILIAAVWTWLPQCVKLSQGGWFIYRGAILGSWLTIMALLIQASHQWLREKQYVIGADRDRFVTDARAALIAPVLAELEKAQPRDTLVVLPEGVMLNYLTRRVNPTPFVNFIPAEMIMYGEDQMFRALEQRPPDWLIFLSRDTKEYGARTFGRDYAQRIGRWVDANYELVGISGADPLNDLEAWGASLFRRKQP